MKMDETKRHGDAFCGSDAPDIRRWSEAAVDSRGFRGRENSTPFCSSRSRSGLGHAQLRMTRDLAADSNRHNPNDNTSAQTAIMPMNSVIDTSAAASSTTARIMLPSHMNV